MTHTVDNHWCRKRSDTSKGALSVSIRSQGHT